MTLGGLAFLAFLPLDALLIEEVQLPLSDEFFLSTIVVVGGGGAAFFFRLRPKVVVFGLSEMASTLEACREAEAEAAMALMLLRLSNWGNYK